MVLTQAEVRRVLAQLAGVDHLLLSLLYGTGMRLMEGLRLRVKDIDFSLHQILVREGKGAKDRVQGSIKVGQAERHHPAPG